MNTLACPSPLPPAADLQTGLVSVIMPCYNAAATLGRAIQSVRDQHYPHWELWIIDDQSTDTSAALAATAARQDARIKTLRNHHAKGVAGARNTGIEAARGEFIAFLDADDRWLPDKLRVQVTAMREQGAVFSATSYQIVNDADQPLGQVRVPARIRYTDLLRSNTIGCLTAMYNQGRIGRYRMPASFHHEDYLTWLAILETHGPALGIDTIQAVYCKHRHSLSATKSRAARWQWRIYRKALGLPWWQAVYLFGHYAWRGLLKHRR